MDLISNLNKSQLQAVNSYDCPLLILAGAGTGKTTTITCRIANLILHNIVAPEYVLAVTFTNKAANEMKERIVKLVGMDANRMWVGTFHGISARILRMYSKAIGLEPNFLIIDENDRKRLIQKISKELQIDEKRFPQKVLSFIITQLKEKCISADDDDKIDTFKYKDLDIKRLYKTYQFRLRSMNAVDFDDLIFECVQLFKREPKILQDLQHRFQYITCDEYQDTNELQHLWLRLLAGSNANVCCVGDEDQSIYGWRGAEVKYILGFQDDFPGAKIIRLEDNYRSNQAILDCAMSVISNNKQRYNKTLKSSIKSEYKPTLFVMENDKDENLQMVQQINQLKDKHSNLRYSDFAILVRATYQMRSIEDCFIKNKIPYKIIGGIKFYDRKEIKDLISYVRFIYSLTDEISLERIINYPKRGIGEKGFNDIIDYIKLNGLQLFDGLFEVCNNCNILSKTATYELSRFLEMVNNLHNQIVDGSLSVSDFVEKIYHQSGYSQALQDELEGDPEVASRIDNIREFIGSIKEFENIDQFLEHISLMSASDDDNYVDGVNIMTMHSAKGLEFNFVFLPAWDEGCFPSQKTFDEKGNEGLEEERRLAYVALTRAKDNFYVFTCKQRMQFGRIMLCQPSRFVEEMRKNLTEINKTYRKNEIANNSNFGAKRLSSGSYFKDKYKPKINYTENEFGEVIRDEKSYSGKKKDGVESRAMYFRSTNYYAEKERKEKEQELAIGDKVISEKFGKGVIKGVYGKFYDVKFEDGKSQVISKTELSKYDD